MLLSIGHPLLGLAGPMVASASHFLYICTHHWRAFQGTCIGAEALDVHVRVCVAQGKFEKGNTINKDADRKRDILSCVRLHIRICIPFLFRFR
ncbi:hypothetical protein F4819DRAFT_189780 [Hypoxylon fuscum]|nr:hypothetical protein F4819DRAFT_189780 [Hypoxylon fuscum]